MSCSWNRAACGRKIGMCGYTSVPENGRIYLSYSYIMPTCFCNPSYLLTAIFGTFGSFGTTSSQNAKTALSSTVMSCIVILFVIVPSRSFHTCDFLRPSLDFLAFPVAPNYWPAHYSNYSIRHGRHIVTFRCYQSPSVAVQSGVSQSVLLVTQSLQLDSSCYCRADKILRSTRSLRIDGWPQRRHDGAIDATAAAAVAAADWSPLWLLLLLLQPLPKISAQLMT